MPPIRSGFTDFTQALYGTTNNVINILDQQMKEKARSDLLNMQANLDIESNRFMNQLKNSSNYENWEQQFNDFIQKQGDIMQKNSRNQYTAKAANEMLQGYSVNMRKQVENEVFNLRNNDMLLKNQSTKQLYRDIYSGQDYIDNASNLDNLNVLRGSISSERYKADLLTNAETASIQHYNDIALSKIDSAIKSGAGLQSILDIIDRDTYRPTVLAVDPATTSLEDYENGNAHFIDISNEVNLPMHKDKVKKSVTEIYPTRRTQIQQENDHMFSALYSEMMNPDLSPMERMNKCKSALFLLRNEYRQGELMDSRQLQHWTDAFSKSFEAFLKENSGSSASSGSARNESFAAYFKYAPENALQDIKNGKIKDRYTAVAILQNEFDNDFFSRDWTETDGLTDIEKRKYWENNIKNSAAMKLLSSETLQAAFDSDPIYSDVRRNFYSLLDDLAKNSDKYSKETARVLAEFSHDFVASSGGTLTDNEIKNFQSMLNACRLDKIKEMSKGNLGNRLATSIENDTIFTTTKGEELTTPENRERLDKLNDSLVDDLYKKTGEKFVFKGYQKVKDDVTPVPHFYNPNTGEEVFASPVYDKKGEATGEVEYISTTGKKLEDKTKEVAYNDYMQKKEAKYASKQQKNVSENQTAQAQKIEDARSNDIFTYARNNNSSNPSKLPAEFREWAKGDKSDKEFDKLWKGKTDQGRFELLKKFASEMYKDKKYEVSIEPKKRGNDVLTQKVNDAANFKYAPPGFDTWASQTDYKKKGFYKDWRSASGQLRREMLRKYFEEQNS